MPKVRASLEGSMAGAGMSKFSVTIPIKTVNESNQRDYWRKKAKRSQSQRWTANMIVSCALTRIPRGNLIILLTRIGPRKTDSDSVPSALKAVRDGVADAIGRDDGDESIQWNYAQERGEYGVRVEFV